MRKVLVIGAGGFVGHYLTKQLTSDGCEVHGTYIKGGPYPDQDIVSHELDILDQTAIEKLLIEIEPDWIIHLAAQSSVALSWKNPGLTIDINIKGTSNLLEAIKTKSPHVRLLLIGSAEEYGKTSHELIKETESLQPQNIYAITKVTQEMLGKLYVQAYGLDIVMARPFNHIGPGQSTQFVVPDFCEQVARIDKGLSEPVIKVGNLKAKRDFTDVRDVVRAYSLLLQKGEKGEVYNIGSSKPVTIQWILDTILSLSKKQISVEIDPQKYREIDIPVVSADITKIITRTGWKPQREILTTIEESFASVWVEPIR